ncbi:MAG TPA: alpha/beta hydrolase [Cellulomonas sp.]
MGLFHRGPTATPTVVLVHGAFADSSGWTAVAAALTAHGHPVLAVANPLRDLDGDAAYLTSVLATVDGPVVLVGHSYAGSVITRAAADHEAVSALVYVAAFIPQVGESSGGLNALYPGSLLTPDNLVLRPTPDGRTDLTVRADRFGEVYAGGLEGAALAAAAFAQRPITAEALGGELTRAPERVIPSWQVVATQDNAVPPALQRHLAERVGATVLESRSGHHVAAVHPEVVVEAVLAATAVRV